MIKNTIKIMNGIVITKPPSKDDCFHLNCLPVLDTGSSKNITVLRNPGSGPG